MISISIAVTYSQPYSHQFNTLIEVSHHLHNYKKKLFNRDAIEQRYTNLVQAKHS